jgi:hypothetical protein
VAERQTLFDAILVGRVNSTGAAKRTPTLCVLALQKMPLSGTGAENLSARCDFESLCGGLLCFNALGTSHKSVKYHSKRAGTIEASSRGSK